MTVPVISPKRSYDPQNEATFREEMRRALDGSYDRRSNLTVPFGKKLQFTSAQGQVITFGYNVDGEFTVQQDAGTPFGLASISYVTTVESTLEGSIATLETTLRAEFEAGDSDVSALITTEATTRASADTALAARATALEASVDTPTTGLLARVTVNEAAIVANDTAISGIETEISAAREGETSLLAKINVVEAAIVSGDAAVASSVTTLTATVNAKNQTFVQTSAPTALAVGDLWIDSDDNNKLYRATAAGTGSWVAVAYSDTGKVTTFAQTTAPTALAVGDLWIDTDDNNKVYRATATGSGSWSAVDDARIAINATAIATVDGKLSASYALTVDGGGRIASMKLLSNGTTSSVKFTASTFQVYNGTTDEAPFEVSGGVVKIKTANVGVLTAANISVSNLAAISADLGTITAGSINASVITAGTLNVDRINTGSIVTAKLEANAVSQGVSGETDAAVDVLNSSWVTLESESITVPDATTLVKVDWSFFVGVSGEPEDDLLVRIKRDATVIYETTAARVPAMFSFYTVETGQMDFAQTFTGQVSGFDADTPGAAGTYTYTLEAKADLSTIGPWTLSRRRLFLMQFKR